MRPLHTLVLCSSAASVQAASAQIVGNWQTTATASICDFTSAVASFHAKDSAVTQLPAEANSSNELATPVRIPSTYPSIPPPEPPQAAGGLIPSKMEKSMVGLLGFLIVGLMVL